MFVSRYDTANQRVTVISRLVSWSNAAVPTDQLLSYSMDGGVTWEWGVFPFDVAEHHQFQVLPTETHVLLAAARCVCTDAFQA